MIWLVGTGNYSPLCIYLETRVIIIDFRAKHSVHRGSNVPADV